MANLPGQSDIADVVGLIYESTIDPGTWSFALQGMSGPVNAFFSSIDSLSVSPSI
jgi:hypothetical protein